MPKGSSHTLDVTQNYKQPDGMCNNCHMASAGHGMTDAVIEEEREGYQAALALFQQVLVQNGIYYSTNYPYFYPSAAPAGYGPAYALSDWTAVGPFGGTGKKNMGSAFNYNLLLREPGAFVHNRVYAKRLIYDSLEYLQKAQVNGNLNFSNFSSAAVPVSKARSYLSGSILGSRP
jgi:hypothetical protein